MKAQNQNKFNVNRTPWSLVATFTIGVLAGNPVHAGFPYPDSPLQTGTRVPANLMLVLDDSGSMSWDYMPDSVPNITVTDNFRNQVYTRNTIYYNPAVIYRPWRTSVGGRVVDTPYNCVYNSNTLLTGCIDLGANNRVFHVPKPVIPDYADGSNYYRYILKTDGSAERQVWTAGAWAFDSAITTFNWVGTEGAISRTVAQERQNFATWYSFHRTRNKTAKAGVSEAFSDLGEDIRVGFNTIWNNNTYNIPVSSDDGLFRDVGASTNRSTWYNRLQTAPASGSTPLRTSLSRTGDYFTDISATGPYGPQTGVNQLTCRQNFTIFTTDGFWNSDTSTVGNVDNTAGATITSPTGATYTYAPSRPFMDGYLSTLADVAMYYWKTDLRTDLINNVPTTTADPAFWQHMVTFGISIGLKGTLDPVLDLPLLISGAKSWTDPITYSGLERIDDLFHASVNGHGDFVAATNPLELSNALKAALSAIIGRVGSSSNVSANSVSVGSNTLVYQASYITGQWTGELAAFPIVNNAVAATPNWLATQQMPAYGLRNIRTRNTATGLGEAFPTAAQDASLTTGIANYIKGERANEIAVGGTYRDRINVLGDIINSSPAYVKDSNTVFIGANDGMLHAFNGTTGAEVFAYIPGIVNIANLKTLADDAYDHRYIVDGPVVVSSKKQTPTKNILVGSLGRGGKGLYALNVTDPSTFANNNVLWEVGGADTHMGNVISSPLITKVNFNNEMAVIVSNGINSTSDSPALFIYGLESGTLLAKLAPVDPDGAGVVDVIGNNGLSATTGIDYDLDGDVDYLYAGDLKGNVWKFDVSNALNTNWNVANAGFPLFSAKDSGGVAQPISGGVAIAFDDADTPWIYFGTGRYVTSGDPASTTVQTWYGLRDDNAVITGRGVLKERKIVANGILNGKKVRAFESKVYNSTTNDMAGKQGWYIDLVNNPQSNAEKIGERIVGTPIVRNNSLLVSSIIPSLDACASGGSGYVNVVDLFSGSSGIPGASGYLDINGNGIYTDDKLTDANGNDVSVGSIDLGVFMPTDAIVLIGPTAVITAGGSQGGLGSVQGPNDNIFGRISWRELINN